MLDEKSPLGDADNHSSKALAGFTPHGKDTDLTGGVPVTLATGENDLAASIAALDAAPAPAPAPARTTPKTPFFRRRPIWISAICLVAIALIATCVLVYAPLPTVKKDGMTFTREGNAYVLTVARANLTDVTIPSTVRGLPVRSIEWSAFEGCTSLTEVTIPESVTSIGNEAFRGCTSLSTVTIPESVTSIGHQAFSSCTSLTSVTIPDGVTSIEYRAFEGCRSLTEVTIPDSVTSIGGGTFLGCRSLTSVTIPDSVTSIEYRAFQDCTSLTSVTIPASVISIEYRAFQDCTSLTSITIPASVISIENRAFYDCRSLTIYCEAPSKPAGWNDDWNYSNRPVVWRRNNITTDATYDYVVHNGKAYLTKYKERATAVTIPDTIDGHSVVSIGAIFSENTTITSVIIPDSVTSIGGYAFYGCASLTSVTIPDSVTSIGVDAFEDCTSLTSVIIPDSVTSIGGHAFSGCYKLTIYCEAASEPAGWYGDWSNSSPVVWGYTGD